MNENKKYFAFISYKSEDVEWATWIQHELEHYRLPSSFNGRTDVPQELRPVFRDVDELSAGNLPEQIREALMDSQNLIVICSPEAAKSPWVNQEIETFISLGRTERIFPFIVEGCSPREFFPPALRNLPKDKERLGGDISKKGRDAAFVKVVAGMLGVSFDSLWNRYEKEKAEEERKQREQRDKLMISQSLFLAEKANSLVDEGDSYTARLLALKALPKDLNNPDRPYVLEAEAALRKSLKSDSCILRGHRGRVLSVAVNSDGNQILSASVDKTIRVWDAFTGACLKVLEGHSDSVSYACFSNDGKIIASASDDKTIRIWSAANGKCIRVLKGHTDSVKSLSINSDGSRIVSSSEDFTMRVWDVSSGECLRVINLHDGLVTSVAYSNNSNVFASASSNGTVRIWDPSTGECLRGFDGYEWITGDGELNSVVFSKDDSMIVTAAHVDGNHILNIATGECLHELSISGDMPISMSAIFINDDKQVITTFWNEIHIWDVESGKFIRKFENHTDKVSSVAYLPHSKRIVSASYDHTIRIWDSDPGVCLCLEDEHQFVQPDCVVFSHDNSMMATTSCHDINLWDTKSGKILHTFKGHNDVIKSLAFSNDDSKIFSASEDKTICIWDTASEWEYTCESDINTYKSNIKSIVLNHSNSMIAAIFEDRIVAVYDISARKRAMSLKGHTDIVNAVAFSFDDSKIVTAADDTLRVWDSATGKRLMTLKGHAARVDAVAFYEDDSKIVSADWDDTVRIWDSGTGKCLQVFKVQSGSRFLAFGADNSILMSMSDEQICIWDVSTGISIASVETDEPGEYANISHDGSKIAFTSYKYDSGTISIWDNPPLQVIIDNTYELLKNRHLTVDEMKMFYLG